MTALDHVLLGDRPLVVCDVDDVVLHFIGPFQSYLDSLGHRLLPRSFKLHGNIVSAADEAPLCDVSVTAVIAGFFDQQERWQKADPDAGEALRMLATRADVVFLTAMPPIYHEQRRRLLDSLGLHYPLISSREPKGPLVARLHAGRAQPVAFIDDMAYNLVSVQEHVPECLLVHIVPQSDIHQFAPPTPAEAKRAEDWSHVQSVIQSHFAAC